MKKKILLLLPLIATSFSVVGCGETNKNTYKYTYKYDTPKDFLDNHWGSISIFYPAYPGHRNGPAKMERFEDKQDIVINGIKNTIDPTIPSSRIDCINELCAFASVGINT